MIVYRLNNKWDMVKFLDLQAITMRHGDEIKAAIYGAQNETYIED